MSEHKLNDTMRNAYKIANEMVKDRLKERNPEAFDDISSVTESDVIVIRGTYDFIEQVLTATQVPYKLVNPDMLESAKLRPDQIIFVNCPGHVDPRGLRKLEKFVSEGGFLFTTDWALKNILETAFPGFVKYNQRATKDEVVRVEVLDTNDPFLKSIIGPEDDPQWWLEGSSYPIQILNKEKVQVLVSSKEIEAKYGESPVFITFEYGQGKIYHMISHFYLQRSDTRTARHKSSADAYLKEKEIPEALLAKYDKMGISKNTVADVESAFVSSAMWQKILYDKKQKTKFKKEQEK